MRKSIICSYKAFIYLTVSSNDIEGIVLTGSIGSAKEPFDFESEINKYLKNRYPLKIISKESGAIGAAQIAYDIFGGKKEILGIDSTSFFASAYCT